jgi:hypothetical protein
MIDDVENIADEEAMEAAQKKLDDAQKMFDETDDIDEMLDSLCILNGCDGECSIWEFMEGFEEQYAEAVINKLRRTDHYTIILRTLCHYREYNQGCTMFDDYINAHTEDSDDESVDTDPGVVCWG